MHGEQLDLAANQLSFAKIASVNANHSSATVLYALAKLQVVFSASGALASQLAKLHPVVYIVDISRLIICTRRNNHGSPRAHRARYSGVARNDEMERDKESSNTKFSNESASLTIAELVPSVTFSSVAEEEHQVVYTSTVIEHVPSDAVSFVPLVEHHVKAASREEAEVPRLILNVESAHDLGAENTVGGVAFDHSPAAEPEAKNTATAVEAAASFGHGPGLNTKYSARISASAPPPVLEAETQDN